MALLENLKRLRLAHNYTQQGAANAIGVKQQEYERYENGKRPLPAYAVPKLAAFYNVTIHSLFDEPDTATTKGVIDETQKAFYEKQLEEKDKLIAHCKEVICEMRKVIECLRKKK